MADSVPTLDTLRKLRRFLCLGNESALYQAGSSEQRIGTVSPDHASTVHEMLAAERGEEVVGEVSKFLSTNSAETRRGPALYALAVCARHADQSHKTKQAAMRVFATSCVSTADLFTFIFYCQSLTDKKKGWGRALKTGVQRWFDSRDCMTLAKLVTQQKTSCGWSYMDLLRVTHILPKTEGAKMIAKYVMKGLKAAQEEFGGEKTGSDMQDSLSYLAVLEQVKGVTEEVAAAALVEQHKLHLSQVPSHLHHLPQVLAALARQMTLTETLQHIGRLACHQVLEPTFPAASDIAERIGDHKTVQEEKVSPIAVLIAMRVYETGSAAKKWTRNNSVVEALNTAFAAALKHNVKATNKRYLLAVNINQQFVSCWTHGVKVLSPVIGAAGLAQVLAHTEQNPTLAFFDTDVTPITLTDTMQMPEIGEAIVKHASGGENSKCICDLSAPVTWAEKQKKAYDVIIIMTDFRHPKSFSDLPAAFKQYRRALALPHAKLVVCGLTSSYVQLADSQDSGMLDIAGFDASIPTLIHSFVTGDL
ncbi:RNA-binding protein RO60-like [Littorina saxatilis]|uniref:TROVE domain-containing protein n=1 Tax=Littorina saxatilis TaxID=31220 RepID=A0AAN9AWU5_9CAEN